MSRPAQRRFRFRPPPLRGSPELRWTFLAAFTPSGTVEAPRDAETACEVAQRLGLLPRIAARIDPERCGEPLAGRLRDERARSTAHELRFAEALAEVTAAARRRGAEIAPLKGRALVATGRSAAGARPSGDLDLLVPIPMLAALARELVDRGWTEGSAEYEHQAPALRNAAGAVVELHRHLPGVRLDGRASADWAALDAAGLLPPVDGGEPGRRAPARDVLLAHAVVHALAQHGHHASYPGFLLVGDLLDLDAPAAGDSAAPWRRWIERDVAVAEIDAALELTRRLAAGDDVLAAAAPDEATLLARHFAAAGLDAGYAAALKARWLAAPLSDRSPWSARARVALGALAPPARLDAAGVPERGLRRAARWLARPFELVARGLRAAIALRRVERSRD